MKLRFKCSICGKETNRNLGKYCSEECSKEYWRNYTKLYRLKNRKKYNKYNSNYQRAYYLKNKELIRKRINKYNTTFQKTLRSLKNNHKEEFYKMLTIEKRKFEREMSKTNEKVQ